MENTYYFDAYWPYGPRFMPAIFQRLSDAIKFNRSRNTPLDWLLGLRDDLRRITLGKEGESDQELLQQKRLAAQAFGDELVIWG